MLKRTITYTDYADVKRTEDFYFNLTKTEVTKMEMSRPGGLVEHINRIVTAQDGAQIMMLFSEILEASYGEKSADGRRFIKSKELFEAFSQTPAYDVLFMEICTNADKAAAFINGIIPQVSENQESPKK